MMPGEPIISDLDLMERNNETPNGLNQARQRDRGYDVWDDTSGPKSAIHPVIESHPMFPIIEYFSQLCNPQSKEEKDGK